MAAPKPKEEAEPKPKTEEGTVLKTQNATTEPKPKTIDRSEQQAALHKPGTYKVKGSTMTITHR